MRLTAYLSNLKTIKEMDNNSASNFDFEKGNYYENTGLFVIKEVNQWIEEAKARPIPQKLFGDFWYEGELCILFADTNLGKSILAVQIGDSISRGRPIKNFILEAAAQSVVYFDFELSDKQFERRYSNEFQNHYHWHENLLRVELNSDEDIPNNKKFEDLLLESIEKTVQKTRTKILIIDNLTFLNNDSEKGSSASSLMKHLKKLKSEHGLSILVLAHTPKRDSTKPITRNDLAGSSRLMQFCDSSFAIGESHSEANIRYLKQIKVRNTSQEFGTNNVIVCELIKDNNFLQFNIITCSSEFEHLKEANHERQEVIDQAKQLSLEGKTQREIKDELGISLGAVNKYVNS
jgi:archaellum biogenesis ATPase FlaH